MISAETVVLSAAAAGARVWCWGVGGKEEDVETFYLLVYPSVLCKVVLVLQSCLEVKASHVSFIPEVLKFPKAALPLVTAFANNLLKIQRSMRSNVVMKPHIVHLKSNEQGDVLRFIMTAIGTEEEEGGKGEV